MTIYTESAVTCAQCHLQRDAKRSKNVLRLPRGWKRLGAEMLCPKCFGSRYVVRAITFPVAGPHDATWPELREALAAAWADATAAANYITTELYARDARRSPSDEKCPPMKPAYLYPALRERFPALSTASVVAIDHAQQGKYRAKRYEVIWTSGASLPNARYPQPLPIGSQNFRCSFGEDNVPLVSVPIGQRRFTLRLRGGREFRRQLAAFRQIVSGEAIPAELSLLRKRVQASAHRPSATGAGPQTRLMAKIVAHMPREQRAGKSGTLLVRTDIDSLLFALDTKGERIWAYHADHVRRWTAEHYRRLNRWSDDTKAEQRPVPSFAARREAACQKYFNRIDTALNEVTAHLAAFAERRRYATVKLDDLERGFCESLPWSKLRLLLGQKLEAKGITLEIASGDVATEATGVAREEDDETS